MEKIHLSAAANGRKSAELLKTACKHSGGDGELRIGGRKRGVRCGKMLRRIRHGVFCGIFLR